MSYCNCEVDDPPQFYVEGTRRARKQHRCVECGGPIPVGTVHRYMSGKWDSRVETFRECPLCTEVRQWAKISVDCFCSNTFSELHDDCREMVRDLGHLVPGWFMEYGRRVVRIVRAGGTRLETHLMHRRRTTGLRRSYGTVPGETRP